MIENLNAQTLSTYKSIQIDLNIKKETEHFSTKKLQDKKIEILNK